MDKCAIKRGSYECEHCGDAVVVDDFPQPELEAAQAPEPTQATAPREVFIARARKAKAEAMVALLIEEGVDSLMAARFDEALWRGVARRAGQHSPSETTVELILGMLRDAEDVVA